MDCVVFVGVFFIYDHHNWRTAARSLMIFWNNMYVDNCMNCIQVQGHRSFFVSGPKFTKLLSSNVEKVVVDNAVFRLSIAWSVPEIFAIKVQGCPKSSALLITHEPLHSAWWTFARTSTSTTSRTVLNFKVIGRMTFSVHFCVHNSAATRGHYLALSKAWLSLVSIQHLKKHLKIISNVWIEH